MEDLQPVAIKIGMVNDIQIVRVISDCLQKYSPAYVVYDPVMVSTSGKKLMTDEAIEEIKKELFAACDINHSQHRRSEGAYRQKYSQHSGHAGGCQNADGRLSY